MSSNIDQFFIFHLSFACSYINIPFIFIHTTNIVLFNWIGKSTLGIKLTPHGLRRSYETLTIWTKIDKGVLAQIAGHKPSALVDKHYTVRPMNMLREALQEYEDWILESAKQKNNQTQGWHQLNLTPKLQGLEV